MSMNNGDDDAVRLLGTLDRELDPRSAVDVRRAMAVGGRMRRNRRTASYGAVAAVVALVVVGTSVLVTDDGPVDRQGVAPASSGPTPSSAPPVGPPPDRPSTCAISRLPVPSGDRMGYVYGADPTGRYLLGTTQRGPTDSGRAVLVWDNGQSPAETLVGSGDPKLVDSTAAGVAVGSAWGPVDERTRGWGPLPYLYQDGKLTRLQGGYAFVGAINSSGVIVGHDFPREQALVWRSTSRSGDPLPVPGGTFRSSAVDIDEDGTIVGNVVGGRLVTPYVWLPDGTHRALPIPTEYGDGASGVTYGIRGGWVMGTITAAGKERQAVRWNLETGAVEALPFNGRPNSVNAHGWVVGTNHQGQAVLVANGATMVLPDLEYHKAGEQTNMPMTVSDDGRTIAGQAYDRSGQAHAVIWRCT